ncbi:MAG TPA: hypothetical protein VEJ87_07010, partial [Acidimicrobiales bacterium]|nr:hypothetical protein [Acidimicrobiales bacterium]
GTVHLFGPADAIAMSIRQRVREEVGLPVSVGVARTKHLAKVASQVAKPDGMVVVEPDCEHAFLDPLPVELVWGVGPATRARLSEVGIRTIGELTDAPLSLLEHRLGVGTGRKLASLATNVDPRPVGSGPRPKSVGAQAALGKQTATPRLLRTTLAYLVDRVAGRLRSSDRAALTLTVRVRFEDLHSITRSVTFPFATSSTLTLTESATQTAARGLVDHLDRRVITLLGVSLSNLVEEPNLQLELPLGLSDELCRPGTQTGSSRWGVDRAMDAIRSRFGRKALAYGAIAFSDVGRVPEAFRELAQRD